MLISDEMMHLNGGNPITHRNNDGVPDPCDDDSSASSIPPRYRDGRGGIDLEQVKCDQRQARRNFVLAMIRHLTKRRHQRRRA